MTEYPYGAEDNRRTAVYNKKRGSMSGPEQAEEEWKLKEGKNYIDKDYVIDVNKRGKDGTKGNEPRMTK